MRLATERLILREWRDEDRAPYAAFHADPLVREYFYPPLLTVTDAYADIDEMIGELATLGYSFLAVERKADGLLIGEAGLCPVELTTQALMTRPAPIEIGWLFGRAFWGVGYAGEAARAVLADAWIHLRLPELISFTCKQNLRSQRLMQKLGMIRDPQDDFEDPTVPEGHWQRPHVIYRIANPKL